MLAMPNSKKEINERELITALMRNKNNHYNMNTDEQCVMLGMNKRELLRIFNKVIGNYGSV